MNSYHGSVTALLLALQQGAMSYEQLMLMSQMTESTVRKWISTWREAKLVHISGWGEDVRGYPTVQQFSWKPNAEDVPCPAMSVAERVKNWKQRKKESCK